MQSRRTGSRPEDESVALIEALLDAAAARTAIRHEPGKGRFEFERAIWLCACISDNAPSWLIYETPGGAIGWRRAKNVDADTELAKARHSAGDHVEPEAVLAWLEGELPDPWSSDHGGADTVLIERLTRAMRC